MTSPGETTLDEIRRAHPRWTIEQDQETGDWWAYPRWTTCRGREHLREGRTLGELAVKLRMTENTMGMTGAGMGLTDNGHV